MAISLADIKNKRKKIDTITNNIVDVESPTVTSPKRTINIADVKSGKVKLTSIIEEQDNIGGQELANKIMGIVKDTAKTTSDALTTKQNKVENNIPKQKTQEEILSDLKNSNTNQINQEGYTDTGKKFGDYYYHEYKTKGQYKIYSKDNQYYYYDEQNKKYVPFTGRESWMTTKEDDEKAYQEAVKAGYKDNSIKDKDGNYLSMENQLKLDTTDLTDEERKQYTEDLFRQQKNKEEENAVQYGGPGLKGSISELQRMGKNIQENLIEPIGRSAENYQYGELNRQLGLEAYKEMMGEKNNLKEVQGKLYKYQKFNEDIISSQNIIDQNTQNLPNQVSGMVEGIKGAGVLGTLGAIGGGLVGAVTTKTPQGALVGAEKGAKLLGGAGYTGAQAKSTYELEAGYAYQAMIEMGVPKEIAKEEAQKVGTTNAVIESGETLLDMITMGKASQITSKIGEGLAKKYGLETVRNWAKKGVGSYLTNIASEGAEEALQEYSSIQGEKRATKKAGIQRDDSADLERIKSSAIAGAFGGAVGGAVTRPAGIITNRATNNIINNVSNKVSKNRSTSALTQSPITNNQNNLNSTTQSSIESTVNSFNLGKNIQTEKTDQTLKQSAKKYNIDINNDTIKSIDKTLSQRGIKAKFDNSVFINSNENAFWQVNKDGSREVVFNPNAQTNDVLENVAIHELYHDISNSKNGQQLQKELLDFAKTKEGYDEARQSLEQLYSSKYDPNSDQFKTLVDEEAVASILGEKLGNQEFVSSLTVEKPSVAKSVYNWVVDKLNKLNKLTGYKSEKLFWKDIKNKFDSAYRDNTVNRNTFNKLFSIQTDSNGNQFVNVDTDQHLFDGKSISEQNKIAKKYILDNFRKNGLMINDSYINVTSKTANEYTHPRNQLPMGTKSAKMRSSTELDNLLKISKYQYSRKDDGRHPFAKDGWDYYETIFNVDGKMFKGLINIGKSGNKKTLYDITQIKRISQNRSTSANAFTTSLANSTTNNISDSKQNVKSDTKYSMQNSEINAQDVDKAREKFRNYVDKNGFDETAKELQRKYNRLQTEYHKQTTNVNTTTNTKDTLSKSVDDIVSDVKNTMRQDVIDEQYIDELVFSSKYYKDNYIDAEEANLNKLGMTEEEADNHNQKLYDKVFGKVEEKLQKEGISRRYDKKHDRNVYDTQELAKKGYDELLDYLDDKNVNYEVSKSTEAGYVPSIYIKDTDGNTIYRIANHDNGRIDDFDMTYNDAYNTLFSDKDYANWKENIIPKIEKEIGSLNNQDTKYSLSNTDNMGRRLSKEQQEFFKDSKVRDENGNLQVMYHGTKNGGFTVFDINKSKSSGNYGTGFYFASTKSYSSDYVDNSSNSKMYEVYLNITEPVDAINKSRTLSNEQVRKLVETVAKNEDYGIENYGYNATVDSVTNDLIQHNNDFEILLDLNIASVGDFVKLVELSNKVLGTTFDGIITPTETIAFYPEQIKNVDNLNPTNNEDIRYSQNNNEWQNFVDKNFKNEGTGHTLSQVKTNRTLNPAEIANLTKEDASTTPKLPNVPAQKGDKQSKFTKNIAEKTKMLTEENRMKLSTEDDISYYKGITNKQSLDEAYSRLNDGGSGETLSWLSRNSFDKNGKLKQKPTATDVAEGWILLKQYQDAGDYDSMVQVAKVMRQMGTEAGQAVQAYNIMSRLTPEGMVKYAQSELDEAYNRMIKNKTKQWIDKNRDKFTLTPDETAYIVDKIKEASQLPDGYDKKVKLAQIQSLISNKLPPARGAGIKAWMRISMLFNAKTQIRNIMGNAVITPVNAISDTFSALVDRQVAKKTGVRTTGVPNVKNYAKGFKKGLYESYNDFKLDINTRDMQGNRFEIGEGKSFSNRNKIGKALNQTDRVLSFMLDAGDRPFYEATFINSINNQKILNNTDTVTQDMIDIATTEALQRTWQDNNEYTKFVLNTRRGLNKANIKGYGIGDALIPFAKTPANLTKALVDYSPAGLVTTLVEGNKLKNAIETGSFTPQMQHKFVQNLGKATAGSLLYMLGYVLTKNGITTGANDDDKDIADFMKNTLGIQPYSIRIGNHSFTYDWAQPVAAPFAITADLQKKSEETDVLNKILSTIDTGANLILQQSFMESIQNVLTNSDGVTSGIMQQVLDLPSRAVPTFIKQINDMIDTTQRTSYESDEPIETAKNKVKNKIPGLSKDLAPSRDSLGREIKKYGGDVNIFNVFFNPANTSKGKVSESAKEIYKIYQETGDKTIMPRVAPYSIMNGGEKVSLTSKERSEFQKISGQIVEKNVKELVKTSKYKKLDDSYKAEAIKGIVDYSYNYAKSEILDQPISRNFKKAYEYTQKGGALYDFYADKVYKNSKEK